MSSVNDAAVLNIYLKTADAIDLTESAFYDRVESTELPAESLSVSQSPPKTRVVNEGGISLEKQKRKSGAEELWKNIKKRQTSGKMIDKQMEFATKLAQFEIVYDELEVAKADAGAAYFDVPKPADWVLRPNDRPNWGLVYEDKNSGPQGTTVLEKLAKISKLTACMKDITIDVHPHTLRSWYLEDLQSEAEALGLRVAPEPTLCAGAVGVSRNVPRELVNDNQNLALSNPRMSSRRYLYIQSASEIAAHLASSNLTQHLAARRRMLGGQVTLIVLDTQKYFKKGKPKAELEAAIIDLLVSLEIDTQVVTRPEDLVSSILQFSKAVAEEPAKLIKRAVDEQAQFYMRGDNKKCVTVDQQGNGLSRLWQQMLGVLPQGSLEAARAIHTMYNTPRQLAQAVITEEGVDELANLGVSRSAVPGSKARRLGNQMARKLTILFTARDGDLVVE